MLFRRSKQEVPFEVSLSTSFVAGAAAGLVVDVALFPLDTLKTRLQSPHGFMKTGGCRGVYQGIGPVVIASAPTAAVFFVTYNAMRKQYKQQFPGYEPFVNFAAASVAEVVSCVIRVPSEVVKQRRQACWNEAASTVNILNLTLKREGVAGLYRGFLTTILRDIPYAGIQFPLWELFKGYLVQSRGGKHITPVEGAACGAVAGAIAGALTTPLDVVKTRQMLFEGSRAKTPSFIKIARWVYRDRGYRGFFSGFIPRVTWIFLGGGIFFGVYEEVCALMGEDPSAKR